MGVRVILILSGIFGVSFSQHFNSGDWAVDTEPTNKMTGMIFFHEKQQANKAGEEKNNRKHQLLKTDTKLADAFSHFMPDQSKLSLAAGLSRAVSKSGIGMKESAVHTNNLLNYAPKGDIDAPFTSEVIGFDSNSNQLKATGSKWTADSFIGNDVIDNGNSQQINFSQLGIMKENFGNAINTMSDIKEISYFNSDTNSDIDIPKKTRSNFFADKTLGNTFDKAGAVENSFVPGFNNNGFIFDNNNNNNPAVDASFLKGNILGRQMLPEENIEPLVNDGPTKIPLASSGPFAKGIPSDRNVMNNFESSMSENTFESSNAKHDTVKPFPFGQLQGNPTEISKRGPTLKTENTFVDNSRKPILRVKSAFVDMSGRQNPKMKTFGSFVDKSNEMTSKPTVNKTAKPTTQLKPMEKTSFIPSVRTTPTNSDPEPTRPTVSLTGIALPGVASVNTNNTNQNGAFNGGDGSAETRTDIKSNTIISQDTTNTKSGKTTTAEPPQDILKVDMLYPAAPFPATSQSNTFSSTDQSGNNKQTMSTAGVKSRTGKEAASLNNGKAVNTATTDAVSNNRNRVEAVELDYDYDMYADVVVDSGSDQSSTSLSTGNKLSQNTNASKIPTMPRNNGDNDRFITDPKVQIINPNDQIVPNKVQQSPDGQNVIRTQIGRQDFGQMNSFPNNIQNIGNSGRVWPVNVNNVQSNGQASQNSLQNRNIDNEDTVNNGQSVMNNQFNQNQFRNGQGIQDSTNSLATRRDFGSNNIGNNQNILTQDASNLNAPNRFQQNLNNFRNGRISNINSIQNGFSNQNIKQNLPRGLNSGQNNVIGNTGVATGRAEIIQRNQQISGGQNGVPFSGQTDVNGIPTAVQTPNPSNDPRNIASNRNNLVRQNLNQRIPTQIQSSSQNEGAKQNTGGNQIIRNIVPGSPPQPQTVQGFTDQFNSAQTVNGRISVPTGNMGNQINSQANRNVLNSLSQSNNLNVNSAVPNRNIGQNNINRLNANLQNSPAVSNNINGQISRMNRVPNNLNNVPNIVNNFPRSTNGFANNEGTGQNMVTGFQNQNNLMNSQTLASQRSATNFGNGAQRIGQNNLLQNRQLFNSGNFPNRVRNIPRTLSSFPGNVPQFQNNLPSNILSGNSRNAFNNFRQNMAPNSINIPGANRFVGNTPLNTNSFGPNTINRQFGSFR